MEYSMVRNSSYSLPLDVSDCMLPSSVFITTIPGIFTIIYGESIGIMGLNYFSLGLGMVFASWMNSRTMDKIYMYFKTRNNGIGEPEYRVRKYTTLLESSGYLTYNNSNHRSRLNICSRWDFNDRMGCTSARSLVCRRHGEILLTFSNRYLHISNLLRRIFREYFSSELVWFLRSRRYRYTLSTCSHCTLLRVNNFSIL